MDEPLRGGPWTHQFARVLEHIDALDQEELNAPAVRYADVDVAAAVLLVDAVAPLLKICCRVVVSVVDDDRPVRDVCGHGFALGIELQVPRYYSNSVLRDNYSRENLMEITILKLCLVVRGRNRERIKKE